MPMKEGVSAPPRNCAVCSTFPCHNTLKYFYKRPIGACEANNQTHGVQTLTSHHLNKHESSELSGRFIVITLML